MKKLLTVAAITIFAISTYAQDDKVGGYKPCEGSVTTEVGLTGGLNNAGYDLNTDASPVGVPMLKFRYFLKEDLGLRLGFSAIRSSSNSTPNITVVTTPTPTPPPTVNNTTTTFASTTNFGINLGVEKHFAGTDRLSTYAGADLLLGYRASNSEVTQNPSGDYVKTKNANGNKYFGLSVITGADYYIAKKVYLGVELGLAMLSISRRDQIVSSQTTVANVKNTIETTTTFDGSDFAFVPTLTGGVRLGYQF